MEKEQKLLFELSEIDKKLMSVKKELAEAREEKALKEIYEENKQLKEKIEVSRKNIEELERKIRKCELDSESYHQEKKKIDKEIYSGKINDHTQLEKLKQKAGEFNKLEDQMVEKFYELTEELNEKKEDLNEKEKLNLKYEKQIEEAKKSNENVIKEKEKTKTELLEKREELVGYLPSEILEKYKYLVDTYPYSAVINQEDDICEGCNIALPTSVINELKVEGIINCTRCGRFLVDLT